MKNILKYPLPKCRGFFCALLLSCFNIAYIQAQDFSIITTKKQYKSLCKNNGANALVDVKKIGQTIFLDLRYASTNNFTKTNLYTTATTTYVRKEVGNALTKVCDSLKKLDLYIKIWDAYRPYAATQLMWDLIKDERYVANPKNGSGHNRGWAVDLTLVDKNGKELPMGTGFDNFTDTAHHSFTQLSADVLKNRATLKNILTHYGFNALDTEWWHYSFATQNKNILFNLSFAQLKKLVK